MRTVRVIEEELQSALVLITQLVEDRALPFFDRYHDLSAIALGTNPDQAPVIAATALGLRTGMGILADRTLFSSGNHPYRAMSAITLAYLARLEKFDALVARYEFELSPMKDPIMREKFPPLVRYLRELRANGTDAPTITTAHPERATKPFLTFFPRVR